MNCDFDYTVLDKAIEKYGNKESSLIAVLQAAQEAYRYLPKEIFPYLSEKLKLSEAKIYGVATFYENFSLEPKGKYVLKVCDGTACHVRHSTDVLDYLRKELGLSATKKTTDDRMFTVETVACLGACGLAPVITVNGHVYSQMTKEKAAKVLEELREGKIDA
ncbi:MAG TPA: NAD(P)H-dependent oxidoreductase subunit E [Clostridiales bacterium]|nr:NAD(P)H-dependent oxidoreductase subunit E [Faecalibacterium sp.]MDY3256073.1 NAD(P)H-dependent oxidoreductase subunit E [Eubacteriales bacterium]HCE34074.1 NAD(P)H-dependent oxidoreductase subunit E [Clostridiales bacterium]